MLSNEVVAALPSWETNAATWPLKIQNIHAKLAKL